MGRSELGFTFPQEQWSSYSISHLSTDVQACASGFPLCPCRKLGTLRNVPFSRGEFSWVPPPALGIQSAKLKAHPGWDLPAVDPAPTAATLKSSCRTNSSSTKTCPPLHAGEQERSAKEREQVFIQLMNSHQTLLKRCWGVFIIKTIIWGCPTFVGLFNTVGPSLAVYMANEDSKLIGSSSWRTEAASSFACSRSAIPVRNCGRCSLIRLLNYELGSAPTAAVFSMSFPALYFPICLQNQELDPAINTSNGFFFFRR